MARLYVTTEEMEILRDNFSQSPSYIDLIQDVSRTMRWYYASDKWRDYHFPSSLISDFAANFHFHFNEVIYIFLIGVLITWIRYSFERYVCESVAKLANLIDSNRNKFSESAWKCFFYTSAWFYCLYLVRYRYDYFDQPYLVRDDWSPGMLVPVDIKLLYFVECGFYIHSIYATLYMDSKRKDFYAMILHHILTVTLIFVSYATRYHKVGLLVLFVHDVTDICLEATKIMRYLAMSRNGHRRVLWDYGSQVGFLIFTLFWFLFRLYWYPLKVLYTTGVVAIYRTLDKGCCFYGLFNVLLWILLALNLYWLFFILQVLFKVLTNSISNVGDIRDNDEETSSIVTNSSPMNKKKKKV